jgi:hypothetical protein
VTVSFRPLLLVAGALAIAVLGASFQTHSWPSTIMILIPTVFVLVLTIHQPIRDADRPLRGLRVWLVLVSAILLWEAFAFVQQPDWSLPSHDYPTMSTLLDPVLENGPLRIVGWLAWLGLGWQLVRT